MSQNASQNAPRYAPIILSISNVQPLATITLLIRTQDVKWGGGDGVSGSFSFNSTGELPLQSLTVNASQLSVIVGPAQNGHTTAQTFLLELVLAYQSHIAAAEMLMSAPDGVTINVSIEGSTPQMMGSAGDYYLALPA